MSFIAPPLDLSHMLGRTRNRISGLGIELEGGWDKLPKGVELQRDSSIHFPTPGMTAEQEDRLMFCYTELVNGRGTSGMDNEYRTLVRMRDGGSGIPYVGEHPSPPLLVKKGEWKKWLRTHYPPHINHTCGMHVHMSFYSDLVYQRLIEEDLSSTVLEYIKLWTISNLPADHHIWSRLNGQSEYCQHLFHGEQQVKLTRKRFEHHEPGHRYTVINYPYAQHKTVECRLLPMMPNHSMAEDAIQHLLDVVNAYIVVKYPPAKVRHEAIVAEVPVSDIGFEESFYITL